MNSHGDTNYDHGPDPYAANIFQAAQQNKNFRTAYWTGHHLQMTLMSIPAGEDIGLESHPDTDQYLRIEGGRGIVRMGARKDRMNFQRIVDKDTGIFVPAGTWHNIINTGMQPLKISSVYAPPNHPRGTVHRTKAEAAD